jgi:hypothetical protein
MKGTLDSRQLDGPECETVFVNPTVPARLQKRYRPHPVWVCGPLEKFEQVPSFTLPVNDGFKSSVWLGTVADRKTEARVKCGATISQKLFFV